MRITISALLLVVMLAACSPKPSGHSTRPDDAVIRGINYVGVTVSDIKNSTDFYREVADLATVDQGEFQNNPVIDELAGRQGVQVQTQLLKSSNAQLRLMQFANPSVTAKAASPVEVYGPGIAHVCLQVAKTTQTYQRLLQAGGTHIGDPEMQLNPRTHVAYAYGHDLDKAILEIEHVDVEALNLPEPPKNDYRIRHVSLATPDIDRATDFYAALLQEKDVRRTPWWRAASGEFVENVSGIKGAEIQMSWIQVRNMELEIFEYVSNPTESPVTPRPLDATGYNMIVFDVTDLATVRNMLVQAGGTIVLEKPLDGVQTLFGRDPDGNLLGFQKLPEDSILSSQNFADNGL